MDKQQWKNSNNLKFFEKLLKESPFVPGDEGEFLEGDQIEWINPKLIKEGQDFVHRNSYSINLAHFFSLLLGFSFKSLTTILLQTGNFTGVKNSMARILETEMHITSLYESELLTQKDRGFKNIQKIRKMHTLALKKSLLAEVKLLDVNISNEVAAKMQELITAMKKDLECFSVPDEDAIYRHTYYPVVLMSQFDMVMTQYGFVGIVYLFPKLLGIQDTRGIDGFIHLWAVIGRLIGIQDRFNLALHADKEIFMNIFKTIGITGLMKTDLTAVILQENLCDALALALTNGRTKLKSNMYYFLKMSLQTIDPNFNCDNIYKLMDWHDFIDLRVLQFIIFLVYHLDFAREWINKTIKIVLTQKQKKILGVKKVNYNMDKNNDSRLGRNIIF